MLTANEKFPIGFWNYTATGVQRAKDVKDWADLGMTMAISPEYYEGCDKNIMLEILDECEKYGIKVILADHRARFPGSTDNPDEYRKKFASALEDFGSHPAVMGFHVGDEPGNDKTYADAAYEHKLQLEMAPNLMPHLNLLPYWQGQEESHLHGKSFEEWAGEFAKESGMKLLCYDCYAQMNPNDEGLEMYFQNLYHFSRAADENDLIPWTTLLSVGHFRYRVPNEDDFRWQLNTAVASGMKGILWFFIYERAPFANYRLPPIDEFGERTENFERLSRVNRHFQHQFGTFFNEAKHIATYHAVKNYGGYEMFKAFETDDTLIDFSSMHGLPAIISFYEYEGKKHVVVVNNSTKESGLFILHLPKNAKTFQRYSWNHEWSDIKYDHWDASYEERENYIIGGDWLAPGQMKVYRIEK